MKKYFIILMILVLAIIFRTELLIGFMSLFIDEGGRDKRPLHVLINKNDINGFRKFVESPEGGLNVYDLAYIARHDNDVFFNILVNELNFDVDMKNQKINNSALLIVANGFSYEGVKRLVDAGANVNFKDSSEKTPLVNAINAYDDGDEDKLKLKLEIVKLLLESGADVNVINQSRLAPIPLKRAIISKNNEIVQLLIDFGADIHHKDEEGYNYFFYAYRPDIAKTLLDNGLDINDFGNKFHKSPVQFFVTFQTYNLESIKFFVSQGADLCHLDAGGNSVLDYAERRGIPLFESQQPEFNQPKIEANRKTKFYQLLVAEFKAQCSVVRDVISDDSR